MENQQNLKALKASETGPNEEKYLSREEFVKELAKLAAAYPYFAPTELTWEVYWEDLGYIPARELLRGLKECRTTLKFFPTVSEIVAASIGRNYNVVQDNPHRESTIQDIIWYYQQQHHKDDSYRIESSQPKKQIT